MLKGDHILTLTAQRGSHPDTYGLRQFHMSAAAFKEHVPTLLPCRSRPGPSSRPKSRSCCLSRSSWSAVGAPWSGHAWHQRRRGQLQAQHGHQPRPDRAARCPSVP